MHNNVMYVYSGNMSAQENESNFYWERAFAGNMARLRAAKGMSQNEFAKRISARGLPFYQATVQRVENGERSIRLDEACVISEFLEISLDAMMTNFNGPMETASYVVDRLKRYSKSLTENAMDDFGEFLNEFTILCVSFDELLAASGHKPNAELSWMAAWIIKCGWVIECWTDLERYTSGLHAKSGDWHESRTTDVEPWNEYKWLQEEDADLWNELPEKDRPLFLADLDPADLQHWIVMHTNGKHPEAP